MSRASMVLPRLASGERLGGVSFIFECLLLSINHSRRSAAAVAASLRQSWTNVRHPGFASPVKEKPLHGSDDSG